MRIIGNIIWFIFGGLEGAIGYFLGGVLFCVTIVGIPVGMQLFKLASLALWPFGKEIVNEGGSFSFLVNVIWCLVCGLWMAAAYALMGFVYCITIIGIPFGRQCFKLARLSLSPFGLQITD